MLVKVYDNETKEVLSEVKVRTSKNRSKIMEKVRDYLNENRILSKDYDVDWLVQGTLIFGESFRGHYLVYEILVPGKIRSNGKEDKGSRKVGFTDKKINFEFCA